MQEIGTNLPVRAEYDRFRLHIEKSFIILKRKTLLREISE